MLLQRNLFSVSAVTLALAAGCDPVVEVLNAETPEIYADVCREPQKTVDDVFIGGDRECDVDLGVRDISVLAEQRIRFTNPTKLPLSVKSVALAADGDPTFEIVDAPAADSVVAAGFSFDVIVHVRPRVEAAIATVLEVTTNAGNMPVLRIPIALVGVDNGIPVIEVSPLDCDYGFVAVGGVKNCLVTIANTGTRELVLDDVDFAPVDGGADLFDVPSDSELEEPFSFVGQPPRDDEPIQPGTSVTLSIRFTPDALGNFRGLVSILSSDPNNELVDITLGGVGVTPPVCEISIKSVNGQTDFGAIEPLDNVILTIAGSTSSSPAVPIVAQQWRILRQPAGSGAVLTSEDLADVGFSFDNGDDLGVDLAGEYCVGATVVDGVGTESVNECTLCFEAVPQDNFLVQLSWDTDGSDMDLHVTKMSPSDEYCISSTSGPVDGIEASACGSGLDCCWTTCKASSSGAPEWDGVPGRTAGDGSLDIDDVNGFGPENINVDEMTAGFYLIGVNAYSGAAGSTIRLFIFGRLAGEFFIEQSSTEWNDIAIVRWPEPGTVPPCVEDLTDGTSGDELAECDAVAAP